MEAGCPHDVLMVQNFSPIYNCNNLDRTPAPTTPVTTQPSITVPFPVSTSITPSFLNIATTSVTPNQLAPITPQVFDPNPQIIDCNSKKCFRREKYMESGCFETDFENQCNLCENECRLVAVQKPICIYWECVPHSPARIDYQKATIILSCSLLFPF